MYETYLSLCRSRTNYTKDTNSKGESKLKYKFDEPIPTKSGRSVKAIWDELQDCWASYKKYFWLENDKLNAIIQAKHIRKLQEDLGITIAEFSELGCFTLPDSESVSTEKQV
jgi:hypothetical protein